MLTDRQLLILQVIIDDFIRSAQPVGSRSLSKKEAINYSSATIRNEMSDLEDLGFLEKTHTSSGRVPSEKGYRFYVDHLLSPQLLQEQDINQIHAIFKERILEMERLVQRSAQILSDLTNYTSVALGPAIKDHRVKQIQIVPLHEGDVIAIIITNTGHVEHKRFAMPILNADELEKVVRILNDKLAGVPIADVKNQLVREVSHVMSAHVEDYELLLQAFAAGMDVPIHDKLVFGGKMKLMNQPEFGDLEKLRLLMDMIEHEDRLYPLLTSAKGTGINVRIGKENGNSAMDHCSLITATFPTGDGHHGALAIIGPTRMEYSRVISLLNVLSGDLSKAMLRMTPPNE